MGGERGDAAGVTLLLRVVVGGEHVVEGDLLLGTLAWQGWVQWCDFGLVAKLDRL